MSRRSPTDFFLGAGAVQLLVRQRRPMLMIDFVDSFRREPVPTLTAARHISTNEIFFEGHFPQLPIWPGALTMEGLGQAATVLTVLTMWSRETEAKGGDPATILEALRNVDRGYRLHPGYRPEEVPEALEGLRTAATYLAVGASVDLKFSRPVFPGCRLDYRVAWTETVGDMMRFAVEASVDGETAAKGSLTGAWTRWTLPGLP